MSNNRVRTTSLSSASKSSVISKNQNSASKKNMRTKPGWDSTQSDLAQHKASNEELERRKASCKSKNMDLVKFEKQKQEIIKNKKNQSNDAHSQLALLKEILYDDDQIKNIIMKSDSTLKVVKDFFDEDTNSFNLKNLSKKQPKINLTLAPNVADLNESNLPHNSLKINEKKTNIIQPKCKNLNDSDNENRFNVDSELSEIASKIKSSNINLKDLQQVINNLVQNNESKIQSAKLERSEERKDNSSYDETSAEFSKQQTSSLSSFNDELRKALNDLESKLGEFEKHLGKQKNADAVIKKPNQSKFGSSSYTINLIQIVSNLIDYLRDAIIELNYEKLKQAESSKQLDIHRKLIDGLTTEVLSVKEQNEKIINGCMAQNAKLAAEMDQIKIFLKTSTLNSGQFVQTFIEPKLSAFTSQPQLNISKPIAQQQGFYDDKTDKFSERLNAMLQYDIPTGNLVKSTSMSQFQNMFNNKQIPNRPLSAFNSQNNLDLFTYQELSNRMNLTNRPTSSLSQTASMSNQNEIQVSKPSEFITQIDLLKNKNLQVQQRLKQLQEEHRDSFERQNSQSSEQSIDTNSSEEKYKLEALERVKQEQQLLKEQINLLNKQRETAQQELEILSNSSVVKNDKNYIQNALMKHLEQFSLDFNENGANTPGLSPIPPEMNEGKMRMSEIKNLEVTPTRNDHRIK